MNTSSIKLLWNKFHCREGTQLCPWRYWLLLAAFSAHVCYHHKSSAAENSKSFPAVLILVLNAYEVQTFPCLSSTPQDIFLGHSVRNLETFGVFCVSLIDTWISLTLGDLKFILPVFKLYKREWFFFFIYFCA